jgi:hypothetical protein
MRVAVIGSVFGELDAIYEKVSGQYVSWVISTGNFGVWPDPVRADRRSRQKGTGDFLKYLAGIKRIPIPTIMVGGAHEDYFWINKMVKRGDAELIENLHYLVNGNNTFLDDTDISVKIVGLGGTYSPKPNPGLGHYTVKDVQRACTAGPMDLFLSHEAPDGELFGTVHSVAKGLNKVCFATRPRLLLHGKYAETRFYKTAQTYTPALCVGHHDYQLLDITKDSIVPVSLVK